MITTTTLTTTLTTTTTTTATTTTTTTATTTTTTTTVPPLIFLNEIHLAERNKSIERTGSLEARSNDYGSMDRCNELPLQRNKMAVPSILLHCFICNEI